MCGDLGIEAEAVDVIRAAANGNILLYGRIVRFERPDGIDRKVVFRSTEVMVSSGVASGVKAQPRKI